MRKTVILSFALLLCLFSLSSCSYRFIAEFDGTFLKSNRQVIGFISYGTGEKPHNWGRISLGSIDKEECRGLFEVASKGQKIFGLALKDTVYAGQIYCVDGRQGQFEYVSRKPKADGETGILSGQIGNQLFQIEIKETKSRDCYSELCQYGATWKYDPSLNSKWENARKRAEGKSSLTDQTR